METISKGDSRVVSIIDWKSCNREARYRLSDFCVSLSENGVNLIKNTLSCEILRLSDAEWKALEEIRKHHVDFGFIEANGLEELVRMRLLVEEDSNDAELYTHTLTILRMMESKKKGYNAYTILPTTDCNARCTYCFEEGCTRKTMSRETAQRLVEFICETHCDKEIQLDWSGGEPLLAHETISFICKSLAERQVPFYSSLTTNATLVNAELVKEMKEVWKLNIVKVSLDGEMQDYAARKRYIQPEKYTYDGVIRAIHLLAGSGMGVKLSINFDHENIGRLESFLEKLDKEFGSYKNVNYNFTLLNHERNSVASSELLKQSFDIITAFESHPGNKLRQYYLAPESDKMKLHVCTADNLDASIIISPDGSFHNCGYNFQTLSWGNIFDGVTNQALLEKLRAPAAIDNECRHCPFLPECTPFYKRHCPICFDWCRENKTLFEKEKLHRLIKKLLNPKVEK